MVDTNVLCCLLPWLNAVDRGIVSKLQLFASNVSQYLFHSPPGVLQTGGYG